MEKGGKNRMATRKNLVEAWQGIDTLLCALDGKGPEMTDKEAIRAIARALWVILDWIVRRIDRERMERQDV